MKEQPDHVAVEGADNSSTGGGGKSLASLGSESDDRPQPPSSRNGKDGGNTWAKLNSGDWGVRGKPGQIGMVEVRRKNGSTSKATLGKCVWNGDGVALYEVQS